MPWPRTEYPLPRSYVCDGTHAVTNVRYADSLSVMICADPCCAKITHVACDHQVGIWDRDQDKSTLQSICEWSPDGTVLSCRFCGKDGT